MQTLLIKRYSDWHTVQCVVLVQVVQLEEHDAHVLLKVK